MIPATGTYYVDVQSTAGAGAYNVDVYLSSQVMPPAPGVVYDYYAVTLTAGQVASFTLNNQTPGSGTINEILTDAAGNPLGGAGNATTQITNFVAPANGIYDVRVGGDAGIRYSLVIVRDAGTDLLANVSNVYFRQDGDGITADIWADAAAPGQGAPTFQIPMALFSTWPAFSVTGSAAGATVVVDFSAGDPLPAAGLLFNGQASSNKMEIVGTANDDTVSAAATSLTFSSTGIGPVPMTLSNVQSLQMPGGTGGADTLNITGGSYVIDADTPATLGAANVSVNVSGIGTAITFITRQHLAALGIGADCQATLSSSPASDGKALILGNISILGGGADMGRLDLTNNAMILDYSGTSPLASIEAFIRSGRENGQWTGPGIASSTAAADTAAHQMSVTALGYADNAALAIPYTRFAGESVGLHSLLVRYTVLGDADLSGTVDDKDAAIVSLNYDGGQTTGHHWQDGDFDMNGSINDDDAAILGLFYGAQVK